MLVQTPGLRLPASLSTVISAWPPLLGCPCLRVSLHHTHPAQLGSLPRLVHRQIPCQSAISGRRNSKPLGAWGRMDTCTSPCTYPFSTRPKAESLCCSPETVTSLLTDYIPIQNKFKKEKKKHWMRTDIYVLYFNIKWFSEILWRGYDGWITVIIHDWLSESRAWRGLFYNNIPKLSLTLNRW